MEQPSDARAWQVAEPMPPVAPVMRARWLERSLVSIANCYNLNQLDQVF